MKVSGRTKVCALIGDPVEHSLSPLIQNAAFQSLGLDYVYVVFTVKREELGGAISGMRSLGLHGLNVTMPHKIAVIQYLDHLDEVASEIGAVNTILNKDGKLIGYNTDGLGALKTLISSGADPSGKKIVILGAGGASRAISFTLAKKAREIVILNRTLRRAKDLVNDLTSIYGGKVKAGELTEDNLSGELINSHILINATSLGMHPSEAESPVNPRLLRSDLVVFDLVYKPFETRLLKDAGKVGARVIHGLDMLIHQGALSFEIWTGRKAPIDIMMKIAIGELKEDS